MAISHVKSEHQELQGEKEEEDTVKTKKAPLWGA